MPRGIRGSGTRSRRTPAAIVAKAPSNNVLTKIQGIWAATNALKGQVSNQYLNEFNKLLGSMAASVFTTGSTAIAAPQRRARRATATPTATVVRMTRQRRGSRTATVKRGRPAKQALQATA